MKKFLHFPAGSLKFVFVLLIGFISNDGISQTVTEIWGGARRCLALKSDGSVWSWGSGGAGAIGDSTYIERDTPVRVHGPNNIGFLDSVIHSMAGEIFNFVLRKDGTVWSWGGNAIATSGPLSYGQLGNGTNVQDSPIPHKVIGLDSVISLGGRGYHALVIRADSSVWAWGSNSGGQLGKDTSVFRGTGTPVKVQGLSKVKAVTGGGFYSLALLTNNTVWSFGNNAFGQLGDGTYTDKWMPGQVSGLTNVWKVSGGWKHAVALKYDSTVWAWGRNPNGELGTGDTITRTVPVQTQGLSGIIAVSGGDRHTLALKSDGTVWAWGANERCECGDGTKIDRHLPVQVIGLNNVVSIAARDYHNIAIKADGSVWTWGWDINGQCGVGSNLDTICFPVQVIAGTMNIATMLNPKETTINVPNPFTIETTFKISADKKMENAELKIFDVLGNEVKVISGINSNEVLIEKGNL